MLNLSEIPKCSQRINEVTVQKKKFYLTKTKFLCKNQHEFL